MKKFLLLIMILAVLGIGVALGIALQGKTDFARIQNFVKRHAFRALDKAGIAPSQDHLTFGKADMRSSKARVKVTVYPNREKDRISPLIYGTNLAPKTESSRDIVNFMKTIGITCFRYPGGDAPGWHWRGGYADFNEKIVNMPLGRVQAVSGLSKLTGAQIIMQVNIESGTPEEAAGLVKFMNQESATPVTYWELGNEAFGEWDASYTTPEKYAQLIKDYSAAMKAVDPSIKIGANWASTYADHVKWDETILKLAGDEIDFLSVHWYPNHTGEGKTYRGRMAPLPEEVMANAFAVPAIVERARSLIAQHAPQRQDKIEITFLEWDGAWDAPSNDTENKPGVLQWSLANAIFYADTFGQFAENGVTVATHYRFQECPFGLIRGWDQGEGWGGQRWDGVTIRPKAFALQMFSRLFGDVLIEKKVEGGLSYMKEKDWWQDSYTGPVAYVSVYTAKDTANGHITIALINKHPESDIPVEIVIDGMDTAEKTCVVRILTGEDLLAQNDGAPGTVRVQESDAFFAGDPFVYDVPARSVVMLEVGEAGEEK